MKEIGIKSPIDFQTRTPMSSLDLRFSLILIIVIKSQLSS